ncbi:NUDIX hydrolase [Streptomyces sp. NBC_00872]|uniref:NUDIX hydrolase n=1 Tax=Streptomyces sp. NBC_00872 TaxID=2903686 RepID=UPI003865F5B3|nr:NUDIX domain-containing protein [Streptomyces sp. NBC_00872]
MTRAVGRPITEVLSRYRTEDPAEAADVGRIRALTESAADPWLRSIPLHVTASALIVHPGSGRVLMRWHVRLGSWLQVGGHGDPGETDPLGVALREAAEETGLDDLVPYPDESLVQVVIVPVPAGGGEPAHEHADLRFVLATGSPDAARPEKPDAPLRWMTLPEAMEVTAEANVREALRRVGTLLARTGAGTETAGTETGTARG